MRTLLISKSKTILTICALFFSVSTFSFAASTSELDTKESQQAVKKTAKIVAKKKVKDKVSDAKN